MSTDLLGGMLSILDVFPNEITIQIIHWCDSTSQAALCRVCKEFKQLAQPQLYRVVNVEPTNALKFDKVLRENPQYTSQWLTKLTIHLFPMIDLDSTNRFLRCTSELCQLSVEWQGQMLDFGELFFPHLCILKLHQHGFKYPPDSGDQALIAKFINSHPSLLHLFVSVSSRLPKGSIDLPNLITFASSYNAPPEIMLSLDKLRGLRLRIPELDDLMLWPLCQDVIVEMLYQSGTVQVPEVLQRLRHHLPHLKSCLLIALEMLQPRFAEDLSLFHELESFGLIIPRLNFADDRQYRDLMIQTWSESCPSLQECVFINSLYERGGRYKIVDGKPQPTRQPCRAETVFPFPIDSS
ncbi:hypothetical protein C8J56DRAFT_963535 [Mycena floridula]|nr:hypothetical protein C8J56DRAFT_963535 [Mycena floridula]